MQDLLKDKSLGELLTDFHNKNKITAMTCHGTIALSIPDARGYVAMLESGKRSEPSATWI